MRTAPLAAAVTAAALAASPAAAPAEPWRWPVTMAPGVSSNFCEYRDGRFHAGIDVRTYGQEGVPCLAVAGGWISRVRASSRGYGKALHLTLDSGEQIVYAHLDEFAPNLEDTLYAAQSHDTAYAVDLRMPAGRFRVEAGDTIAYSGMTGAVAPHLHLEVRDAEDRPLNPFLNGLALPDRLRPVVSRVVFVPLSAAARVGGRCVPWGATPKRLAAGRYEIADTLRVRGPVGVAVAAEDRVNAESGRLAPLALEALAGDSLVTRLALERFSFDQSTEVDLLYHAGALRGRGAAVFQLYPRASNVARAFVRDGGALPDPGDGVVEARVRAADPAGNVSEVVFYYRRDDETALRVETKTRARRDFTVELDGSFFHDGFAVLPAGAAARSNGDAAADLILEARHLGVGARPVAAYADDDTAALWVAGLAAGEARRLALPAHGLVLDIPAGAMGADAVVYARGADRVGGGPEGLARRSRAVRVGPVGWVLRAEMTVELRADAPAAQDAVYRYDDYRRAWSFLPTERDTTGGVLSARAGRPGVFAVFRDDSPPRLGRPAAAFSHSWATGDTIPEIHVPVDDAGAGFDEARTEVRVAGRRRFFRWDFVGKKIIVPLRGEPIIGPLSIRVIAYDRVGNRSAADATVGPGAR